MLTNGRYETTLLIPAPIERVYDYVADFPRHAEWNGRWQTIRPITIGAPHVGSLYQVFLLPSPNDSRWRWLMKRWAGIAPCAEAELTVLKRPSHLAWRIHLPSRRYGDLWRLNTDLFLSVQADGIQLRQQCQLSLAPTIPRALHAQCAAVLEPMTRQQHLHNLRQKIRQTGSIQFAYESN